MARWALIGSTSQRMIVLALLALHAGLLAWTDFKNAPNSNEASHLATGIYNWQSGRFDLYPVNPPLVRMLAALPVLCAGPTTTGENHQDSHCSAAGAPRPEFNFGIGFIRVHRERIQHFFAWARGICIPLSLLGGYCCWLWASELYGWQSGIVALALWCCSPNILAWSATICPDAPAATFGVVACYFFWRWLRTPDGLNALVAGLMLGLSLLTKMTWLVATGVWPVVWLVWLQTTRHELTYVEMRRQCAQLFVTLAVGFIVLNLGYAFEGTFRQLGEYRFVSRALAGNDSIVDGGQGGNRFGESWFRNVPLPLPCHYVRGVDLQKLDFERGLPSYLCGEWKDRGRWYYYAVCAALKVPLGTWALAILAIGLRLDEMRTGIRSVAAEQGRAEPVEHCTGWRDELVLLAPAIAVVVVVSSQAGFSRHFRYVLSAFPFLFIWISGVACVTMRRPHTIGVLAASALIWSTASSMWIYPHSMSYFNELAGGPTGGHRYLLDSNIDWGQDVFYLKEWCHSHPEARPLYVLFRNSFSDDLLGITNNGGPPIGPASASEGRLMETCKARNLGPKPGWYALSIQRIHDEGGQYLYFLRFRPVAMAGYSIYIYHITPEEANRVRRELELPELTAPGCLESHTDGTAE